MYIDYHTHILPNMDDGASSPAESIEMLQELKKQGVGLVFLTPHFYAKDENIDSFLKRREESYSILKESMNKIIQDAGAETLPQTRLGAEVYYFEGIARSNELSKLKLDSDENILLLEMPMRRWSKRMYQDIEELAQNRSFNLTLAHIDRYMYFLSHKDLDLFRYLHIGMQANAEFFTGMQKRKAIKLLQNGYISYIGSDTHNMGLRRPNYQDAINYIESKNNER